MPKSQGYFKSTRSINCNTAHVVSAIILEGRFRQNIEDHNLFRRGSPLSQTASFPSSPLINPHRFRFAGRGRRVELSRGF